MDDLTALLAAIILQPDEDTPRLAYADALRERDGSSIDSLNDEDVATMIEQSITERWGKLTLTPFHSKSHPCFRGPERSRGLYERGFVCEVELPVNHFLQHADSLIWHPSQKAKCSRCEGDGKAHGSDRPFEWTPDSLGYQCRSCRGSGKSDAPRPCPPTAQPIRRVTLTDGNFFEPSFQFYQTPDNGVRSYRWPGVEFTMPNVPAFAADDWVACGDGYLPKHEWVCEINKRTQRMTSAIGGDSYEVEVGRTMSLSLTYTLSPQDPPLPFIDAPHTFGPIRAVFNDARQRQVVIEKVLLRSIHVRHEGPSFAQPARIEITAEAIGNITTV